MKNSVQNFTDIMSELEGKFEGDEKLILEDSLNDIKKALETVNPDKTYPTVKL